MRWWDGGWGEGGGQEKNLVFMMVSGRLLLLLHLKSPKEHLDFDPDFYQDKRIDAARPCPPSLSGLFPRLALLATLAFGHLTEPIWLGVLIVALPDLATPIARSFGNVFGTIEIRTIGGAGLKSPR